MKQKNFICANVFLTRNQIEQYNPPPNPAKVTDPRAKDFIKKHGRTSWEVDALRPDVLNTLLSSAILENIDESIYNDIENNIQMI